MRPVAGGTSHLPLPTSYRLPFCLSPCFGGFLLTRFLCSFPCGLFLLLLPPQYLFFSIAPSSSTPTPIYTRPNVSATCYQSTSTQQAQNIKQGLTTTIFARTTTVPTPASVLQFLSSLSTSFLDFGDYSALGAVVPRLVPLPPVSLTHVHRPRSDRFGDNSTSLVRSPRPKNQ